MRTALARQPLACLVVCAALAAVLAVGRAQAAAQAPPAAADFVRPGPAEPFAPPLGPALDALQATSFAAHIALLASPAFEGRALGTRGLEAAAEYVTAQLALAGIPGLAAPGTRAPYAQRLAVRAYEDRSARLEIAVRRGDAASTRVFVSGVDLLVPDVPPGTLAAPIVFAGYGLREAALSRDDYKGLDVHGALVLVQGGVPPGAEWQAPELLDKDGDDEGLARGDAKRDLAASLGAAGVLLIDPGVPARLAASQGPPPVLFWSDEEADATIPVLHVTPAFGQSVLALASAGGLPPRPGALPAVTASLHTSARERKVEARNVLAVIDGTDALLRREAVVVGAHMDHLGRVGDQLHPGADDNASGTSALLEIARTLATMPRPRRTVVLAFWTGEEEGHFGSEDDVRHPAWPIERTTAYVNLDMIGHPWTLDELTALLKTSGLGNADSFLAGRPVTDFLEVGVATSARELAEPLMRAARGVGMGLHVDWTDGRHGGSDYRAFARAGRPFLRFFGNYFDGYHEPTDTAERLDAGQVLEVARLALATTWLVANR